MFLLRAAFWLTIAVMFIPSDPNTGTEAPRVSALEAFGAAQATISDLSGFCGRNPGVCVTGSAALDVLAEKAQNGARLLYRYLDDQGADADATGGDTGTLNRDDRTPAWREPRKSGSA
jgi:hypothetical protein